MCLLSFFPEGVQPDAELLRNGTYTNDDGHGFALIVDGVLRVRHGMSADRMIDAFVAARKAHPDGPALFHSRYGTGGGVDKTNCHPFFVRGDGNTIIAHNGVLFAPRKNETRCDTRIFAENIFPKRFRRLDSERTMRKLVKYLGTWNKLVILTTNPAYKQSAYIVNEAAGSWHEGAWYSNDGFRPFVPSLYSEDWENRWQLDDDGKWYATTAGHAGSYLGGRSDCDACGARRTVNPITLYCDACTTCAECGDEADNCLCYTPMALDRAKNTRFTVGGNGEAVAQCSDCGNVEDCTCFDVAREYESTPVGWPKEVRDKIAATAAKYAVK